MFAKKQKAVDDPIEKLKALMPSDVSDKENNHIYFYTDVNQDTCLDLNRKITALNKELLKYAIEYDCEPPNIYLHINSYGGCLFSAFSVIDTIKKTFEERLPFYKQADIQVDGEISVTQLLWLLDQYIPV